MEGRRASTFCQEDVVFGAGSSGSMTARYAGIGATTA